jgi:N-succinyl-L-ornithine transcarbamylase
MESPLRNFRNFTSVHDVPDLAQWIADALALKANPYAHEHLGKRKTLGLLFFNASLRTRVSTQRAARNLGMDVFVVNVGTESWKLEFADGAVMDGDTVEHIREGAAVLGRYCDILAVRAFAGLTDRTADYNEEILNAVIRHAGVPVVSLESAIRHPLQSFADVITMSELLQGELLQGEQRQPAPVRPKIVLTWAPHPKALPQAVPNSFAEWVCAWQTAQSKESASSPLGSPTLVPEFVITHPKGFELADEFTSGVQVTHDQSAALENADFVYVKNWSPYAEKSYGAALGADWRTYQDWTLTAAKLAASNLNASKRATAGARVLHCLPTRRNVEIADDVLNSSSSLVIDEAANRIVSAQTVLKHLLEGL